MHSNNEKNGSKLLNIFGSKYPSVHLNVLVYMVGPSHKVSSRRETDGRQMSFRSWTLQLIKCLNGVGNFICCKMLVMSFHNECF